MGTRVMGTVGIRRSSKAESDGALLALDSGCPVVRTSVSNIPHKGMAAEPEEPERRLVHDPDRNHVLPFPSRNGLNGFRVRFHTAAGTHGEALGFVATRNLLFLATPSMMPPGTSLLLESAEECQARERQTATGTVTATCPVADEFGFPPGIGVRVAKGLHVLHGNSTSNATQSGY